MSTTENKSELQQFLIEYLKKDIDALTLDELKTIFSLMADIISFDNVVELSKHMEKAKKARVTAPVVAPVPASVPAPAPAPVPASETVPVSASAPAPASETASVSASVVAPESVSAVSNVKIGGGSTYANAAVAPPTKAALATAAREKEARKKTFVSSSASVTSSLTCDESRPKRSNEITFKGLEPNTKGKKYKMIMHGLEFIWSLLKNNIPSWMYKHYFFISNFHDITNEDGEVLIQSLFIDPEIYEDIYRDEVTFDEFMERAEAVFNEFENNKLNNFTGNDENVNFVIERYFSLVFTEDFKYTDFYYVSDMRPLILSKFVGAMANYAFEQQSKQSKK